MLAAIVTIRPDNAQYWPEVGMTHRTIVRRSTLAAVQKTAAILAGGKPCRVEAYALERFYAKAPDSVTYLNGGKPD